MCNRFRLAALVCLFASVAGCGQSIGDIRAEQSRQLIPIADSKDFYFVDDGGDVWFLHEDKAKKVIH